MKRYLSVASLAAIAAAFSPALALAETGGATSSMMPIGVGIAMGVAALGGTLGQGKAISAGLDAIGRNPAASGKVFTPMLVGLAFVESLVILSFAIAYLLLG
ncbi:MAG: ATP synthase F0 subunit C [Bdellovibrionota bacterium]|nr:MAG: ATP synthase F0 subunit C [Bdellovibrionota bacterium]